MKIFCHFYTEMFCTGCGCRQCQAEVKIGEQKFTTSCGFVNSAHHSQFCTSWPILHKLANSAQVGRFCTSWPILHKLADSAQVGQFCTSWPILHKLADSAQNSACAESQHCDIHSLCLYVYPFARVSKSTFKLHKIFCACYLWLWLSPLLMNMYYINSNNLIYNVHSVEEILNRRQLYVLPFCKWHCLHIMRVNEWKPQKPFRGIYTIMY